MSAPADGRPAILVVDPDPGLRQLVRVGLELDGAHVLEASTVQRACDLLTTGYGAAGAVGGVVVGDVLSGEECRQLEDGVHRHAPGAVIAVLFDEGVEPRALPGTPVRRTDIASLSAVFGLPAEDRVAILLAASDLLASEADEVAADWAELCRWDPMSPPDTEPPVARSVVLAVAASLNRPQPLGWGPDPEVEAVINVFAGSVGSLEVAVAQLVCLREAVRRRVRDRIPPDETHDTTARLDMVIDRAIQVSVRRSADRLERQAFIDPLTGLLNRRALERDLRAEMGRAARYGRRFSLMVLDMDGLKAINDEHGHAAGDSRLRALAGALADGLRLGDNAYRLGGDEFVVLLPETGEARASTVADRILAAGAPPFSWGTATYPNDGNELGALLDLADRRLYDARRARGHPTRPR